MYGVGVSTHDSNNRYEYEYLPKSCVRVRLVHGTLGGILRQ